VIIKCAPSSILILEESQPADKLFSSFLVLEVVGLDMEAKDKRLSAV
jgi:hypothetical protein